MDDAANGIEAQRGIRYVALGLFGAIAGLIVVDLVEDHFAGSSIGHIAFEGSILGFALLGVGLLWAQLVRTRRRAGLLHRQLSFARADSEHWRAEARDILAGLAAAIDTQFQRWALSPAEREVALLLLKGLPLREIAALRHTSERTVRQQSLAVYKRAGVAGRAELSAFFLEDLLLPPEPSAKHTAHM